MKPKKFFFIVLLLVLLIFNSIVRAGDMKGGLQFYYRGNLIEALEEFQAVIEEDSTNPRAYFFLGNTYRRLEDYNSAQRAYQLALEIDPGYGTVKQRLAELSFNQENWETAAELYQTLIEEEPDKFEYRFCLGVSLFKTNKLSQALEQLEQALEIEPHSARGYYYLGRLNFKRQNFSEAENYFERAIEIAPSEGKYYFYRGLTHFRREDLLSEEYTNWQSARDFREAIELGYDNPRSRFMLGNFLLKRGLFSLKQDANERGIKNLRDAISHYRKVLMNDWKASNAYHNMGVAYLGIGEYRLARRAIGEALEIEPTVPFFHDTYGVICFRLGEFNRALSAWSQVWELDSDYEKNPFGEPLELKSLSKRIQKARLRR